MPQSRKRRHSVSPERNQKSPDLPDCKKRKFNLADPSVAGPSGPRVDRSPVPLASDSSATLDGDSPPPMDKGKGKAVEVDPIMLELEQLRREVAQKNELLEQNRRATSAVLQALSCHVCLETMSMPYALSCGHMSCQTCLVRWFTPTKTNQNNVPEGPDIDWLSDEESDAEADGPDPEAGPTASGSHANVLNGHGNPNQNSNGNGGMHHPAPAAPDPDAEKRDKTCPHCRSVIMQRPIQIYPVKDILGILHPGGEQEAQASQQQDPRDTAGEDLWKDLFPLSGSVHNAGNGDNVAQMPAVDIVEDVPNIPLPPPAAGAEPDPEDEFVPLANPNPNPPPPFIDEEDGVRRCGLCLHEIWDGECTNPHCHVFYSDRSGESDGDVDMQHDENVLDDDGEDEGGHHHSDAGNHAEEDGYESSFIDDGDNDHRPGLFRRLQRRFFPRRKVESASSSVEVTDEDDFIPGPSRRYPGGRQDVIVISSSDEDTDIQITRRPRRGRSRQIIEVDEEEDHDDEEEHDVEEEEQVEGDVRSSEEGNVPVNEFVSEHEFTASGVHYIEEDDEFYGNEEVPYVWDEDRDAEGTDHVVPLEEYEEDDQEDDQEGYES